MQQDSGVTAIMIVGSLLALGLGLWMLLNPRSYRRAETIEYKHPEAHELSSTGESMYRLMGLSLVLIAVVGFTTPAWLLRDHRAEKEAATASVSAAAESARAERHEKLGYAAWGLEDTEYVYRAEYPAITRVKDPAQFEEGLPDQPDALLDTLSWAPVDVASEQPAILWDPDTEETPGALAWSPDVDENPFTPPSHDAIVVAVPATKCNLELQVLEQDDAVTIQSVGRPIAEHWPCSQPETAVLLAVVTLNEPLGDRRVVTPDGAEVPKAIT